MEFQSLQQHPHISTHCHLMPSMDVSFRIMHMLEWPISRQVYCPQRVSTPKPQFRKPSAIPLIWWMNRWIYRLLPRTFVDRLRNWWRHVFRTAEPQFPGRRHIANGEESVCQRGIANHKRGNSENKLAQQNAVNDRTISDIFIIYGIIGDSNRWCSFEVQSPSILRMSASSIFISFIIGWGKCYVVIPFLHCFYV